MPKHIAIMLLVLCVGALGCAAASTSLVNDEDEAAWGVTVQFSEPAVITNWDKARLPSLTPSAGQHPSFTFSGGVLPVGGWFWFSWSPSSASVVSTRVETSVAARPAGGAWSFYAEPDWAAVHYTFWYPEGVVPQERLAKLFFPEGQVAVTRGQHWGLLGSDIRGLKVGYSYGIFLRVETWTASVRGAYQYEVHLWPYHGNYGPLAITLDPGTATARAGMSYLGQWTDLTDRVTLIRVEDDAAVVYMPEFALPSGDTTRDLFQWNRVLAAVYCRDARCEFYQLSP